MYIFSTLTPELKLSAQLFSAAITVLNNWVGSSDMCPPATVGVTPIS